MEYTLQDIVQAGTAVSELSKKKTRDQKIFYWLTVARRKLSGPIDDFERTRQNLLPQYAMFNKETNQWDFEDQTRRLMFNKAIDDLLKEKQEIELNKIKFTKLLSDSSLEITPDTMSMLMPFLDMDEPADSSPGD